MRWIHERTPLSPEELTAEYKNSRNLGKVRLGERHLFFPKFSGTSYLPYEQVAHIWMRQEEVTAKMCCGRANFDRFFLMVKDTSGAVRRAELTERRHVEEALSLIAARNPCVEVGYHKPVDPS